MYCFCIENNILRNWIISNKWASFLKIVTFCDIKQFFHLLTNKNWYWSLVLRHQNQKFIQHIALCHIKNLHGRLCSFCNKRIIETISVFLILSLSVIICLAKFVAAKNYKVVFIVIKFDAPPFIFLVKNTFKRWMVIYFIRVNAVSKSDIAHGK